MFRSLLRRLRSLWRDESGPTAVEYAVGLSLIIVVCLAAVVLIGNNMESTYTEVGASADVPAAPPTPDP